MSSVDSLVRDILIRDRRLFRESIVDDPCVCVPVVDDGRPVIVDFTEYSPLHNGHLHCMLESKRLVGDGIFVAVVPGPFERSGRGLPYVMTREARAEIAVEVGADIVVEGPPMGVMGSGQYSLCLAKMFQAMNASFIPRGYKPVQGYDKILDRINQGHEVVPKPYKILDKTVKEVLLEGKLEEDNYVIVSLSKSLSKIGFNYYDKFLFIKRIEGVSGTIIRQALENNNLSEAEKMLPEPTIKILEREIKNNRAPLHIYRDEETILNTVNTYTEEQLNQLALINPATAKIITKKTEDKEFKSIEELLKHITQGFSSHYKNRVLSVLEAKLNKDEISKYINCYPSNIRILNYKNKQVLNEFTKQVKRNFKIT